ncbi:MAG: TIGR01777 family oxidoreductase [Bacteroidetes bacterium]|nr:TIGR01777 family oxidoreductase [Bacteroidota bacterium]
MKIIVFGGTGFIGSALLQTDLFRESEVYVVTRDPESTNIDQSGWVKLIKSDQKIKERLLDLYTGQYGIVNLAGASISHWPWTGRQKKKILDSRIRITKLICDSVNQATQKPEFIIQGSAVGYYGFDTSEVITEDSSAGKGFLSMVTQKWEEALSINNQESTRVIYIRTGLVLGRDGGLLRVLRLPFYFFAGGHFGNGHQYYPWIHIADEVGAIVFLIQHQAARGAYNLTAPEPVRMKELMKIIGKCMKRPSWLHLPAFLIRLLMGASFADELVLGSQQVKPDKLIKSGYQFRFTDPAQAISDLI